MLSEGLKFQLGSALQIASKHKDRLGYALAASESFFPLNEGSLKELAQEQIPILDQMIYRFSQLQDTMGRKLFPLLLNLLGDETRSLPFIDILNRLEHLEILNSSDEWMKLREIRNMVAYEYPDAAAENAEALNALREQSRNLIRILESFQIYIADRGLL